MCHGMKEIVQSGRAKGLVFHIGTARESPNSPNYGLAAEVGLYLARHRYGAITGGCKSVMEAALLGACAGGAPAIGVVTKGLVDLEGFSNTHSINYIVNSVEARELVMLSNATAIVAYPGGFGTVDELLQALVLMQLGQMAPVPIILMGGKEFWQGFLDAVENGPIKAGLVSEKGKKLFRENIHFAQTPEQVLEIIKQNPPAQVQFNICDMAGLFENDMTRAFNELQLLKGPFIAFSGGSLVQRDDSYYASVYNLAKLVAMKKWRIYTNGSRGVAEAVHLAAKEAGIPSVGLTKPDTSLGASTLEHPQLFLDLVHSRNWVLQDAAAFLFPAGGLGTWLNMFKCTVRIQIGEIDARPVLLTEHDFYRSLKYWLRSQPLERGYIDPNELKIIELIPNHGRGNQRVIKRIAREFEKRGLN